MEGLGAQRNGTRRRFGLLVHPHDNAPGQDAASAPHLGIVVGISLLLTAAQIVGGILDGSLIADATPHRPLIARPSR